MRVSCSRVQSISSCGRQYEYRYIQRLTTTVRAFALFFGSIVDHAVSQYVYEHALGRSFDLVKSFQDEFAKQLPLNQIQYPQHWDADVALKVGTILCERFPDVWHKSNLVAAIDVNGEPIVQRRIIAPLPNNHELEAILDFVVMDILTGEVGVLDLKTTSMLLSPESPFGFNSFQLTTYQYAADFEFSETLGPMSQLGFMELVKRKPSKTGKGKGPTVELPRFFPRRNKDQLHDMLKTYEHRAEDILKKRFHRPVNAAFNSPCDMCDFSRLCVNNDRQGITVRPIRRAA